MQTLTSPFVAQFLLSIQKYNRWDNFRSRGHFYREMVRVFFQRPDIMPPLRKHSNHPLSRVFWFYIACPLPRRCCQTNEPKHQHLVDGYFYELTKERHSVRAASRFSLNVLRFESDLCELNKLWNEAWIAANFCRLCIRLNRSMALSRRRMGKWEFSTLLFAHRLVICFFEQPSSLAAAP